MDAVDYTFATREMKVVLVLLVVTVCSGVALLALRRTRVVACGLNAGLLLAVSFAWLRVSQPIEGLTLKRLSFNHGVTVADLVVIPCMAVAAGLLWVAWRDRRGPDPIDRIDR